MDHCRTRIVQRHPKTVVDPLAEWKVTLQVMFDLSLLGVHVARDWTCAGICRVTKNWAASLARAEEISLQVHYGTGLSDVYGALNAARQLNLGSRFGDVELKLLLTEPIYKRFGDEQTIGFRDPIRRRDLNGIIREATLRSVRHISTRTENAVRRGHSRRMREADVFHDTSFPAPNPGLNDPIIAGSTDVAKVITIYDVIPVTHPEFFPNGTDQLFRSQLDRLNGSHWIVCSSEHAKIMVCELTDVEPARVRVIPWAADPSVFYHITDLELIRRVQQKYHIPEHPYLLSVCTLEPRKNLSKLIQDFAELTAGADISDVSLVLVGGTGWIPSVMSEIDDLKQKLNRGNTSVLTIGHVPDADLAALYSGSLAFVYPSLVEGFGLPPLEAMQCGVPVITSNTSALPEVVAEAGLMVDPFDGDQLREAMFKVCSQQGLRSEMAKRSLAQAAQFSWERTARETVDLYKLAVAQPT